MSDGSGQRLRTQPALLRFGTVDVGSTLRGSFEVSEARGFVRCSQLFCGEGGCDRAPLPDWIDLTRQEREGRWEFHVRTDRPGRLHANLRIEYENGTGGISFGLEVTDARPVQGDLALCDSPFDPHADHAPLESLARVVGALPLRLHCLGSLSDRRELRPQTVVLHQLGLLECKDEDVETLRALVAGGTNLVVLADEFMVGTTEAANRVLALFGLQMKRKRTDAPGIDVEEKRRRHREWHARYERHLDSGPAEVCGHPLTAGVHRVHWWRPCPVICAGPGATPLVKNPADHGECFAAAARPGGYVVAVGKSLWSGLTSVGWPYDNDRLFANLLVGGDAETSRQGCG
jgi:hypothetical protein